MLSDLVAGISGVEPAANAPVVGRLSAIQGCGVHADGDKKGNLYQNKLDPARFGPHARLRSGQDGRDGFDRAKLP